MHEDEPPDRLDHLPHGLADGVVGRDGGADGDPAVFGDLGGHVPDALDVEVAVRAREAELRRQVLPHFVPVEQGHGPSPDFQQLHQEPVGDRRLAGAGETGEEDGEPLFLPRGMSPAQLLDDLREREPLRYVATLR